MIEAKQIQDALARFLDTDAQTAQSRFLLLDESERVEVAGWFRALQEGRSVVIEGVADPVPMDVTLCTARIRAVWARSCERRQAVAAATLAQGENGSLDALDSALSAGGSVPTMQA
jgi:hypothetical protein